MRSKKLTKNNLKNKKNKRLRTNRRKHNKIQKGAGLTDKPTIYPTLIQRHKSSGMYKTLELTDDGIQWTSDFLKQKRVRLYKCFTKKPTLEDMGTHNLIRINYNENNETCPDKKAKKYIITNYDRALSPNTINEKDKQEVEIFYKKLVDLYNKKLNEQSGGDRDRSFRLRKNEKDIKDFTLTDTGIEWTHGIKSTFFRHNKGIKYDCILSINLEEINPENNYVTVEVSSETSEQCKDKKYRFDIIDTATTFEQLREFFTSLRQKHQYHINSKERDKQSREMYPHILPPRTSASLPPTPPSTSASASSQPPLPPRRTPPLSKSSVELKIIDFKSQLQSKNINLLIFDWDKTISKLHMYHRNIGKVGKNPITKLEYPSVKNIKLEDYFHFNGRRSVFVELVLKLYNAVIKVAIASFGRCSVMGDTLDRLFKLHNLNRKEFIPNNLIFGGAYDNHKFYCQDKDKAYKIIGDSQRGDDVKIPDPYGQETEAPLERSIIRTDSHKNTQINAIIDTLKPSFNLNNIIFIDDSIANINNLKPVLGHNIYTYQIKELKTDGFGIGESQIKSMTKYLNRSPSPVLPRGGNRFKSRRRRVKRKVKRKTRKIRNKRQ